MRRWILARVAAGSYLHCRVDFKKDKADVTRTRFETTFSEHMPNKDLWARGHLNPPPLFTKESMKIGYKPPPPPAPGTGQLLNI